MDVMQFKQQAGETAANCVVSGTIVGLGAGSTALRAIKHIAHRLQTGDLTDILGVPCSLQVEADAHTLGIPLTTLNEHPIIDLTIDGADEVDPNFELIKGGGGALLREKMVAQASRREIIVVDESKLSDYLGIQWPIPIEILEFGWGATAHYLTQIGGTPVRRLNEDGSPFYTDQGNLILDTRFPPIKDPATLANYLNTRAGIIEHGLFLGLATDVIVAGTDGVRHLQRGQ